MRQLKILIVDDTAANVKLVETVALRMGHTPLIAENGQQAVELFDAERPDLVLMDVMMPIMDGIAATREIKTRMQADPKWVPILLLSALDAVGDIVRGLEAGADDYIVKPVGVQILRAKIDSFARLLAIQDQVRAYTAELENWRDVARMQASLGAHVMGRLVNTEGLRGAAVHHFNIPAETFSGDLICAARTPDHVMHLMLADATGHGLPAALTAIPVAHAFYKMTEKGFPISSIVEEINAKLKAFLPADRFVAATLAAVDINNQTVEVWNGGNPSSLLFSENGTVLREFPSGHPPLGVLPPEIFSDRTETIAYNESCNLLLCSDGLVEAENAGGERFGGERLLQLLAKEDGQPVFERLHAEINAHIRDTTTQDDITCILARTPVERRVALRVEGAEGEKRATASGPISPWRLELAYGPTELRYLDVVPAVITILSQVQALKPHQGSLFLIVSELFNNALDHGLLGLDSRLKHSDGGFEAYLSQRLERLEQLNAGQIELRFLLHTTDQGPAIDIALTDTGPGFDHVKFLSDSHALDANAKHHGRGIALIRNLCAELRYEDRGNTVTARYLV